MKEYKTFMEGKVLEKRRNVVNHRTTEYQYGSAVRKLQSVPEIHTYEHERRIEEQEQERRQRRREIRRNNKYDMVIMDPPSYGRGKNGEVWSIEKDINNLLCLCSKILSDNPISVIINTYTGGLSGTIIENVAKLAFSENSPKKIFHNEIGLRQKNSEFVLPCGITTICEF